jgi:hypothetical protein
MKKLIAKLKRKLNPHAAELSSLAVQLMFVRQERDSLRAEIGGLKGLDEHALDAAVNVACNNWRRRCSILQIALGETALQLKDSEAKLAQCQEMLRSAREVAEGELAARLRYETLLAECMRKNKSHDEKTTG